MMVVETSKDDASKALNILSQKSSFYVTCITTHSCSLKLILFTVSMHSTPRALPACIMYDCREVHGVIIGNTQSVSIPFLFLFFFHQSSLYPIKIFVKCFYLLVRK